MKALLWIIVVIVVIVALVLIFSPRAPEDVQQATITESATTTPTGSATSTSELAQPIAITSFGFTGYGPGKSHVGTFNQYEVKGITVDSDGVPTAGTATFFVNSLTTDTEMLTEHLTSKKEFFDSATYPTITFSLTDVKDAGAGKFDVTGDLTIKGTTKQITFPVVAKADKTFTSEFRVDMTAFGFASPGIVDKEVLINFSGHAL